MNVLEKILEEIEKEKKNIESGRTWKFNKGMEYAEIIIRSHMDEIENGGWIPISERLPKEKGWYQCTCTDKEIWNNDMVINLHYYPNRKEFVDNIRYEINGLKDIEKYYWTKYVIAWRPLPEPYKGD